MATRRLAVLSRPLEASACSRLRCATAVPPRDAPLTLNMDELAINKDTPAVLTDIPRFSTPEPAPAAVAVAPIRIPALNLSLFAITMLTTTMAGAFWSGADISLAHPLADLATLPAGISFSIPLMAILLAHEMGHYLTARRHGVDTSLPYFIPAPPALFLIGTFGAFIRMR